MPSPELELPCGLPMPTLSIAHRTVHHSPSNALEPEQQPSLRSSATGHARRSVWRPANRGLRTLASWRATGVSSIRWLRSDEAVVSRLDVRHRRPDLRQSLEARGQRLQARADFWDPAHFGTARPRRHCSAPQASRRVRSPLVPRHANRAPRGERFGSFGALAAAAAAAAAAAVAVAARALVPLFRRPLRRAVARLQALGTALGERATLGQRACRRVARRRRASLRSSQPPALRQHGSQRGGSR